MYIFKNPLVSLMIFFLAVLGCGKSIDQEFENVEEIIPVQAFDDEDADDEGDGGDLGDHNGTNEEEDFRVTWSSGISHVQKELWLLPFDGKKLIESRESKRTKIYLDFSDPVDLQTLSKSNVRVINRSFNLKELVKAENTVHASYDAIVGLDYHIDIKQHCPTLVHRFVRKNHVSPISQHRYQRFRYNLELRHVNETEAIVVITPALPECMIFEIRLDGVTAADGRLLKASDQVRHMARLVGDVNATGLVDQQDYDQIKEVLEELEEQGLEQIDPTDLSHVRADISPDGVISSPDFHLWKVNLGKKLLK